ncbi:MAG: hypothetical protein J0L93_11020 [Deltaproteobacteria bacterium]|nr:hypothetical protein [Deltaproteobacteria bacterium]
MATKLVKFSGQIDAAIKKELEAYAKETGQTLSSVYSEMGKQFLKSRRVRPEVMRYAEQVIRENRELLERLAK